MKPKLLFYLWLVLVAVLLSGWYVVSYGPASSEQQSTETQQPESPTVIQTQVGIVPALGTLPSISIIHLQVLVGDAKDAAFAWLDAHQKLGAVGLTAEGDDGSSIGLIATDPQLTPLLRDTLISRIGIGDYPSALVQEKHAGFDVSYVYKSGQSANFSKRKFQEYSQLTAGVSEKLNLFVDNYFNDVDSYFNDLDVYAASFLKLASSTKITCALDADGQALGFPTRIALFVSGGTKATPALALVYDKDTGVVAASGGVTAFSAQGDLQNHKIDLGEAFTGDLRVLVVQDAGAKSVTGLWASIKNVC